MGLALDGVMRWVADVQLLSAVLLTAVMIALALVRQPSRRMAIARSSLGALLALATLCALPGWSAVHLLTEARQAPIDTELTVTRGIAEQPMPAQSMLPIAINGDLAAAPQPESDLTPVAVEKMSAAPIDWLSVALGAYATGCGAVICWLACGAIMARQLVRRATPAPPAWLELLANLVAEGAVPDLLLSDEIATPVAIGIWRPRILMPRHSSLKTDGNLPNFKEGSGSCGVAIPPLTPPFKGGGLAPILAHEWAHVYHGDLRTLAAGRLLLVLLWPQPLYWWLRRIIRLDQETLADVAACEATGRVGYAEQLLEWARRVPEASAASRPRLAGAVGLWEGPSQLKRRIAILLNDKFAIVRSCSRRWQAAWLTAMTLSAIALSMVTLQPASRAADEEPQTPPEISDAAQATEGANINQTSPDEGWSLIRSAASDSNATGATLGADHVDIFELQPPVLSLTPTPISIPSSQSVSDGWKQQQGLLDSIETNFRPRKSELTAPSQSGWSSNPPNSNLSLVIGDPPSTASDAAAVPSISAQAATGDTADSFSIQFGQRPRDDAEPNVFKGRTLDENGRPLAGVEVSLLFAPDSLTRPDRGLIDRVITGADGVYRFAGFLSVAPGAEATLADGIDGPAYVVVAKKPGRASREAAQGLGTVVRQGRAVDLVMDEGARLHGRVTNSAGRAIEGAVVYRVGTMGGSRLWSAMTDRNGDYVIDDLPRFNRAEEEARQREQEKSASAQIASGAKSVAMFSAAPRFRVDRPLYAVKTLPLSDIPGRADAVLEPAGWIEGRVVTESGAPMPNALVMASTTMPEAGVVDFEKVLEASARTDDEGKFTIGSLFPAKFDVWAEAPGLLNKGVRDIEVRRGEAARVDHNLTLVAGENVLLKFIDEATGKPPEGSEHLVVTVVVTPVERVGSRRPSPNDRIQLDELGQCTVKALPGDTLVGVYQMEGDKTVWARVKEGPLRLDVRAGEATEGTIAIRAIGPR